MPNLTSFKLVRDPEIYPYSKTGSVRGPLPDLFLLGVSIRKARENPGRMTGGYYESNDA